ncbi:MAG: hypothetical protein AB9891_22080 [Anaerolineaceae bacterium]
MGIYYEILMILVFGAIFSILAILFQEFLKYFGFIRGETVWVIVLSFSIIIIKQVLNENGAIWPYLVFATILCPISVNRVDIINSYSKGRWWWKIK